MKADARGASDLYIDVVTWAQTQRLNHFGRQANSQTVALFENSHAAAPDWMDKPEPHIFRLQP